MGKQQKQWETLYFRTPKITADGDCSHDIKRCLLLGRKAMTNLDSILKNRDIILPTKVHLVKAMIFPVVMYGCESWTIKKLSVKELKLLNCDFGEYSLGSLCMARRSNQSIIKEITPEYSFEGLMLKLKLQYLATWCKELTHWKRPWSWERLRAGGEGSNRGWDRWMASLTRWTWVWVNSRSLYWTGKHGVLQSIGYQIVRHNWATELNWNEPSSRIYQYDTIWNQQTQ